MYDVFVIKGNAAVFKCNIPSFVADHVEIIEWSDTNNETYFPGNNYGTSLNYYLLQNISHVLISIKSLG